MSQRRQSRVAPQARPWNQIRSPSQVSDIVQKVRDRLADAEREGVHLKVVGEKLDDDWLYVMVVPAKPGVRASDHALLMSQIERELRAQGDDQVLLVPVLEE